MAQAIREINKLPLHGSFVLCLCFGGKCKYMNYFLCKYVYTFSILLAIQLTSAFSTTQYGKKSDLGNIRAGSEHRPNPA